VTHQKELIVVADQLATAYVLTAAAALSLAGVATHLNIARRQPPYLLPKVKPHLMGTSLRQHDCRL